MTTNYDCPDCEQFQGRMLDTCLGRGLDGRKDPPRYAVNAFRAKHDIQCDNAHPARADHKNRGGSVKMVGTGGGKAVEQGERKAQKPAVKSRGPGWHLYALFQSLGVTLPGCEGCKGTVARMNAAGVSGCRKKRAEFLAEIRGRIGETTYRQWGVAFAKAVAGGMVFLLRNPTDPLGCCFDEAVRRAEVEPDPQNASG